MFAFGQNKQLLYDFNEIPQAILLNPGLEVNKNWYAGIPALSHFSISAGRKGIPLYYLLDDNGLDFEDKVRAVVSSVSPKSSVSVNQQLELLSGGYKGASGNYYSFGMYQELDVIAYWPRDPLALGYQGNEVSLDRQYRFNDIKAKGELLTVFHFGINKRIKPDLTVGARVKIYNSLGNFDATRAKGYFATTRGVDSLYAHTFNGDIEVRTSGYAELKDSDDTSGDLPGELTSRALLGGNLGLGFDVGFTYDMSDQLVVTGSLLDVGMIMHSKDVERYHVKGSHTIESNTLVPQDVLIDTPDVGVWRDFVEEMKEAVIDTITTSYVSFRPLKLNGSIKYSFGEPKESDGEYCDCDYLPSDKKKRGYRNSLGAQLYMITRPRGPEAALTAFYLRRLGGFLNVKASYTIDKYSSKNIGLGLDMHIWGLNMYLLADNLLEYQDIENATGASFQFGINIISSD